MNREASTGPDTWRVWDSNQFELGYLRDKITANNVIVLSGDLHVSGIDDGTNGHWPEFCSSPLNRTDGGVNGTWSEGTDSSGHKYGLVEFNATQAVLTCKDADGTTTSSVSALTVSAAADTTTGTVFATPVFGSVVK